MANTDYQSIDDYIAQQPLEVREGLEQIRQCIREAVPEAEEGISYQLPTFKLHGMLLSFSSFKNHYGLYPGAQAMVDFSEQMKAYKTTKGAVQFPHSQKLPLKLIREITLYRKKANLEKLKTKNKK